MGKLIMLTGQDPKAIQQQYETTSYLKIMQDTHDLYTVPNVSFPEWVLDRCDFKGQERVLDVGAGSGRYYNAIQTRFPNIQYHALDLFSNMLKVNHAERRIVADAVRLPFADASFDRVMANHMLYHLTDVEVGLTEMRRVLKPDGVLIAATNSAFSMPQFSELMRRGILLLSKPGTRMTQLPPAPQTTFALENGSVQMARHFYAVVRHDLPGELVFPEPEPALNYLQTWRSMREPQLPPEVLWDDLMLVIHDQINRIIRHFGHLSVEKISGVLIGTHSGGFIRQYEELRGKFHA